MPHEEAQNLVREGLHPGSIAVGAFDLGVEREWTVKYSVDLMWTSADASSGLKSRSYFRFIWLM